MRGGICQMRGKRQSLLRVTLESVLRNGMIGSKGLDEVTWQSFDPCSLPLLPQRLPPAPWRCSYMSRLQCWRWSRDNQLRWDLGCPRKLGALEWWKLCISFYSTLLFVFLLRSGKVVGSDSTVQSSRCQPEPWRSWEKWTLSLSLHNICVQR
jgi:hypothetical protein